MNLMAEKSGKDGSPNQNWGLLPEKQCIWVEGQSMCISFEIMLLKIMAFTYVVPSNALSYSTFATTPPDKVQYYPSFY